MIEVVKNIIRFFILLLLQIVVLNNIDISVFLSPMIIVLFVILLPFNTPKWILLISTFLMGIILDLFMNTPGIVSFALVFLAYSRPVILRLLRPREGYVIGAIPGVKDLGWNWFFQYSLIMTSFFHFLYFMILGISQENFLFIIWKTIISSLFTLLVIYLFQLFSIKK